MNANLQYPENNNQIHRSTAR